MPSTGPKIPQGEKASAERTIHKDRFILELKQSLRALAAPGAVALAFPPDGTVKADELALEFDNLIGAALSNMGDEFTEEQRGALQKVDAQLTRMSG